MTDPIHVPLFDLVMCLSNTTDLVSHRVADHQQRVAYIASGIGMEMGLSPAEVGDLVLAGAVHDIGALSREERLECLDFEVQAPHQHAESSALLLREFAPFAAIAELVRHHHRPWNRGEGRYHAGVAVPLGSHILHLADRVDALLLHSDRPTPEYLMTELRPRVDTLFAPQVTEAFFTLCQRDYFWFDLDARYLATVIEERSGRWRIPLDLDGLTSLARMFGHAIDYRSRFTAVHSSGVAAVAGWLARAAGMSADEIRLMAVAGHMHDFGKLSVPREILEKPAALDAAEMRQIKKHPFYAHRLLDPIDSLRTLNEWVSFHHERPNGQGYPFGLKAEQIPTGARVLAVGDVFTAVTEDRPYRPGMAPREALGVLDAKAAEGALDPDLVALLTRGFPEADALRRSAQEQALAAFRNFSSRLAEMPARVA